MVMPTTLRATNDRVELAVNESERKAAEVVLDSILAVPRASTQNAVDVHFPPQIVSLVTRVLRAVANGERLTLVTLPETLTTSVAASQLGISRPTLMKLIAAGELPSHKAGTHTRINTEDVVAFRKRRLARQAIALDELRLLEDQLGVE